MEQQSARRTSPFVPSFRGAVSRIAAAGFLAGALGAAGGLHAADDASAMPRSTRSGAPAASPGGGGPGGSFPPAELPASDAAPLVALPSNRTPRAPAEGASPAGAASSPGGLAADAAAKRLLEPPPAPNGANPAGGGTSGGFPGGSPSARSAPSGGSGSAGAGSAFGGGEPSGSSRAPGGSPTNRAPLENPFGTRSDGGGPPTSSPMVETSPPELSAEPGSPRGSGAFPGSPNSGGVTKVPPPRRLPGGLGNPPGAAGGHDHPHGETGPGHADDDRPEPSAVKLTKPADGAAAGKLDPQAMTRLGLTLGGVVGMLLGGAYLVRCLAPPPRRHLPPEALEKIGYLPWTDRQQLQMVKWGRKLLLVVAGPTGLTVLSEQEDPAEVERLMLLCRPPAGKKAFAPPPSPPKPRKGAPPRPARAANEEEETAPPGTYEPDFRAALRQRWQAGAAGSVKRPPTPESVAAQAGGEEELDGPG